MLPETSTRINETQLGRWHADLWLASEQEHDRKD